jgi:hypothetical protein
MTREQRRRIITVLTFLVVTATCVLRVEAAQSGPRVWIEPTQLGVDANENFQLQVMIEGVEDLGGFQIEVAYDPAIVTVEDAALGDFLTSVDRSVIPVGPQVNDEEGTMVFGAVTVGKEAGASGSGVLATVSCKAHDTGSSTLALQDVQILDTGAGVIAVETGDSQIAVNGAEGQLAEATATSVASSSTATTSAATETRPPADLVKSNPANSTEARGWSVRWEWVVAGVLAAAVGVIALAVGSLRRGQNEGSEIDAG